MSALKVGFVSIVLGTIGSVFCWVTFDDWFPVRASVQADRQDTLYLALLIMSSYIFALVVCFLVYSIWKFRAPPGDWTDGPPIHGNTVLEVIWTLIPLVIVVSFAVYGGWVLVKNEAKPPKGGLQVGVLGQQFAWSFTYPNGVKTGILYLPVGQEIQFNITAREDDVIHSFYVPEFRVKADAVPGIMNHTYAHTTRTGTYALICTELCGIGHSQMRAIVRVLPEKVFNSWLASAKSAQSQQGGA
jgi:cytochrome c oxidase subunit 2